MAVTFKGATEISSQRTEVYTRKQKLINFIVRMSPKILGRFEQKPKILKTESFSREGAPLSSREILVKKREMVENALREFDHPYASIEESRSGKLERVTMSYGVNGLVEEERKPFDPFEEKIKEIESASNETREVLLKRGIKLGDLTNTLYRDSEPLKMACRVGQILWLIDNFNMPNDLQESLVTKLKSYISQNLIAERHSHNDYVKSSTIACTQFSHVCLQAPPKQPSVLPKMGPSVKKSKPRP